MEQRRYILFPYTTLFRSEAADGDGVGGVGIGLEMRGDGEGDAAERVGVGGRRLGVAYTVYCWNGDRVDGERDGMDGGIGGGGDVVAGVRVTDAGVVDGIV